MNDAYVAAEAGRGTTQHPVSDAAIEDGWPQFVANVRNRLEMGARAYGDASFDLPVGRLAVEIDQEMFDIMGWGFILWSRVQALKRKLERLDWDSERERAAENVALGLDAAPRIGEPEDVPEGVRYVQLSDTLARKFAAMLRGTVGPQVPQEGPR